MPGSIRKAEIRSRIWDLLRRNALVRSPAVYGRTPRFRGASRSAERLRAMDVWRNAKRVLVLNEPVLESLRIAAVADGKVLVIPDLTRTAPGWLLEVDPRALDPTSAREAARCAITQEGLRYQRGIETQPVDLMVIGAVAVSREGDRVGKGAGEADLVYALGRSRGFLAAETPVAVLVHDDQIVDVIGAREPTDLPLDIIVTPEHSFAVDSLLLRPKGLHPCMITPKRLQDFPGLRAILQREGLLPKEQECTEGGA